MPGTATGPVTIASNGDCDLFGSKLQLHTNGVNGINGSWPKPIYGKSSSEKRLTKDELVAYLASGCKAKENWRSDLDNLCPAWIR